MKGRDWGRGRDDRGREKQGKEGMESGRKGGRKGREGKARQEEWTLPMASRSLHQVPMEGRAAPALGLKEGQAGPASMVS